jgi:TPR repeat protein
MSSLEEHYQILDASPAASLKEIRLIYRDLAQVWHPDRFQENPRLREKAEAKLKAINHAYEAIRKSHRSGELPKPSSSEKPPPAKRPAVREEEDEALGWYAKAAGDGHADAQCIIATMYAEGQLVPRDEMKAIHWFRKSAAQGHAAAEYQMGLRYYAGGGVPKDPQKAFHYYQRAALQGHAKAQFSLGIMYANGVHISQDDVTAYAWFTVAASSDHPDAETLRRSIEGMLSESDLRGAKNRIATLRARILTNK